MTSKQVLPKQFGMAKLLLSLKINDILRMVYKSAYKLNIYFKYKESALYLMKCKHFTDLDYRMHLSDEMSISYGMLRQIELDVEEKEIIENMKCEYEIVSVRRLKRITDDRQWVNSESIRVGFKSAIVPQYVYVYGSRLKVDTYTFPVSQCSGCWRFGHLSRSCPSKKIVCPKCGGSHSTCGTRKLFCVNCKGAHMSLDKACPIFLKEKEIRNVMSKNNCTYKKALTIYKANRITNKCILLEREETEIEFNNMVQEVESSKVNSLQTEFNIKPSYKDILTNSAIVNDISISDDHVDNEESGQVKRKNLVIKKKKKKSENVTEDYRKESTNNVEVESKTEDKDKSRISLYFVFKKITEILCSDNTFNIKLGLIGKLLRDIFVDFFVKLVNGGELGSKLMSLFNNG